MSAHWFGTPRLGNCFLFALWLWLTGRVRRLFRHRGHWMGETRHGYFVHLRCLNSEDRNRRCPPWYEGKPHIIGGKQAQRWKRTSST